MRRFSPALRQRLPRWWNWTGGYSGEDSFLSVEGGFDAERISPVLDAWPDHQLWNAPNMFFGGAHTVASGRRGAEGAGDPRRGGACAIIA
jgi:gamma-glutamyltranspeptidase/glutathione hydrolase